MLRNRVIVADDQTTFSERLRRELEHDFKVVASVRDGRALVRACDLLSPDIVICDADVPLLPGLDAVETLRKGRFDGRVLIMTRDGGYENSERAWQAGADFHVFKDMGTSAVVRALRH